MSDNVRRAWVTRVLGVHLGQPPSPPNTGTPKGAAVRLAQAMIEWNSTRVFVGAQVRQLQAAILEATSTLENHDAIKANIGNLDALLETLDDSLTVKLNELRATDDEAQKRRLSEEARGIVAAFQKFTAEDALMNAIDDNGFLPLTIKSRVVASLDIVARTI